MARARKLEIGNLVVKFGPDKNLLDFYENIVQPAFFGGYQRKYGDTKYLFHDVESLVVEGPDGRECPAIAGRLIKSTVLRRDQYYDGENLIRDKDAMSSAPSSLFVLLLEGHRLLYVKEQSYAPDMSVFRVTLESFLKQARMDEINLEYRQTRDLDDPPSKASLFGTYPTPRVTLTPIASKDSIASFVNRFSKLRLLTIEVEPTNDEPDNNPFFKQFRDRKTVVGADTAKIEYRAKGGLKQKAVIAQIEGASKDGKSRSVLSGVDQEGRPLRGNNEDFSLQVPLGDLAENIADAAKSLAARFYGLVVDKVIDRGPKSRKAQGVVEAIKETVE